MAVCFQHLGEAGGSLGATTAEALVELDNDDRSDAVVIVGEIGGAMEEAAAGYVTSMSKPVVAFIAGSAAPPGKRMGHAGATAVDAPTEIAPAQHASMGC